MAFKDRGKKFLVLRVILVFLVVALITLLVYSRLPSNKNEEDFQ